MTIGFEELDVGDLIEVNYHPLRTDTTEVAEVVYINLRYSEVVIYSKEWDDLGIGHCGTTEGFKGKSKYGHWFLMSQGRILGKVSGKDLKSIENEKEYEGLFE
jgi:hypothetical protein